MKQFWFKLSRRERTFAVLALIIAAAMFMRFVALPQFELPSAGAIAAEQSKLIQAQRRLQAMQRKRAENSDDFRQLLAAAAPYWISTRPVRVTDVQQQLEIIARRARATLQTVGSPRVNEVSDNIYGIEFALRMQAPMSEISRFFAELEKAPHTYQWLQCNMRPDNVRTPQNVLLTGRIQVLVLSPELSRFLTQTKE